MTAQTLHCPDCGAAISSPDAKSCAYCGAALARVQCTKCFGSMFVGSKYCPHCGALGAQRRIMDVDRLTCPRCKTPQTQPLMEPAELGGIHLDECEKCGGVWLEQGTFERIMNSAEAQSHTLHMLGVMRGSAENKVRYLRCPICDEMMSRHNYAGHSGVIVDFCAHGHGIWFDFEELRCVVEFIRSGGLDAAARADAEQARSDAERRQSTEFWFGKKGEDNFSIAGPTPLRLFEAALWAMRKRRM
jgi:Zn-finger nucleic acid-binding protein